MIRRGLQWTVALVGAALAAAVALQPVPTLVVAMAGWIVPATITVAVLLAACSLWWLPGRPDRGARAGLLALAVAGSLHLDTFVRGYLVAVALAALLVPAAVSLALRLQDPSPGGPSLRTIDAIAGLAAALGVARVLVYDPFQDPSCRVGCDRRYPLLGSQEALAELLGSAAAVTSIVACVLAAALLARRATATRGRVVRSVAWPAALAMVAAGALEVLARSSVAGGDAPTATRPVMLARLAIAALGVLALLALALAHARLRRRLRRVASWLETDELPTDVESRLRLALGDAQLRIAYPTDWGGFADLEGTPVDTTEPARLTELTVHGSPVALIVHSTTAVPRDVVARELGTRARIAIQNESLRKRLERNVDELREARVRVLDAMAETRERLERDLHDGAQQRIVATMFQLRQGERAARQAGQSELAAQLSASCGLVDRSLDQLRRVAHGVHPHLLTSDGLETALVSLTDTTRQPLALRVKLSSGLPRGIDHRLYSIVADVVGRSELDGLGAVDLVQVERDGSTVVTTIRGRRLVVTPELVDRVDAAGGWWQGGPDEVKVGLPCDS